MPVFCEFLVESLSGKPPKSSSSRSRNYESLDINQRVRYLKAINKSDEFIQGGAKDDLVFSLLLSSKQVNAVKTKFHQLTGLGVWLKGQPRFLSLGWGQLRDEIFGVKLLLGHCRFNRHPNALFSFFFDFPFLVSSAISHF